MDRNARKDFRRREKRSRRLFVIGCIFIGGLVLWALFFDFFRNPGPDLTTDDFYQKPPKP